MASIVISGDTSGAVTIEAPAVAGTPTLTLPTTSGTIVTTGGGQTVPFAAGTVSAPSITFTGDTNTGIYSPTADTIAFTEGGVESMRIDSSGNVGIGTTAPAATLQVNAPSTTAPSLTWNATSGQILRNENSELAVGLSSSSPFPLYFQGRTNANTARDIVINPLGGGVGIGVNPTTALQVNGTVTATTFSGSGASLTSINASNVSSGTLAVANGGTGQTSLTANNVLLGNGTSAVQVVAPGSSGNVLTSNGTTWTSAAASGNPTGTVLMWPTNSAPSGYLLCDGTNVSRSTFAALFAVIGTTYGAGDGSTTFGLPNFTNRMPVGSGGTYALAATGGSATTTLATTNLPSHNHTVSISDPTHSHTYSWGFNNGSGPDAGPSRSGFTNNTSSASTGITASSGNTGSGTAFNTISPYLGIRFIIKT